MSEHSLAEESVPPAPDFTTPACFRCGLALSDVIFPCSKCGDYFCFEVPGTTQARMCVTLDFFASAPSTLPFQERIKEFTCHECFSHRVGHLYPVSIDDIHHIILIIDSTILAFHSRNSTFLCATCHEASASYCHILSVTFLASSRTHHQ
jgi:hypothetical protein